MNTGFDIPQMPQPKRYEPKQLHARHLEILRMHHMGAKARHIARELGITPQSVLYTIKSQLGQDELMQMECGATTDAVDIAVTIKEAARNGAEFLLKASRGEFEDMSLSLRTKIAMDTLDREGHSKIQRVQSDVRHGYAGQVGIEIIKRNAASAGLIDLGPSSSNWEEGR